MEPKLLKIGIFGGSFDPVHMGHVKLVRLLIRREALDRVIIIPTCVSPWKKGQPPVSAADRLAMLRIAFEEDENVEISDYEIKQNKSCYTYDTLSALREENPKWDIHFIAGADSVHNLRYWYRGEELASEFKIIWAERFDDISSTDIRRRISAGESTEGLLPPKVAAYIASRGLYLSSDNGLYHRLDAFVRARLKPSRYEHTLGVVELARELAWRYGENPRKAEIAAIFHDAFREKGSLEHGHYAAERLKADFGVEDEDILNAVRWHTTGRPGMCLLEKILKIADLLESGRDFPGVEDLRNSISDDVDITLIMLMKRTREYVLSIGGEYSDISSETIARLEESSAARRHLIKDKGDTDE